MVLTTMTTVLEIPWCQAFFVVHERVPIEQCDVMHRWCQGFGFSGF